ILAAVAGPFLTDARGAADAEAAVHHQDAAMVAIVVPAQAEPREPAKGLHAAAGPLHRRHVGFRHVQRAEAVEEHLHGHARAATLGERFGELLAHTALGPEVLGV